jgi:uncharacterized protein (DUF1015 family)
VPRFEPFRALRYRNNLPASDVAAPPYDVLSVEDVASWRRRHERNITWVDVPQPADADDPYAHAAQTLNTWRHDGTLELDEEPTFTLYRMAFVDESGRRRETVGVLGALEVVDEGAGGVLPHERTTPKAKTDRLDLTRSTTTNLSPVWGLSLRAGLTDLLTSPGEVVAVCTDESGVVHTSERIDDPERIAAIEAAIGAEPVLIADGHHRYAISRSYRDEQRAAGGFTDADLTLTYVAELVESQLSIDAIHRIYRGVDIATLESHLGRAFALAEAGSVRPSFAAQVVDRGALCLVRPDGSGVWLTPKPEVLGSVRALDGAYLEAALADAGDTIDVTYQHGVQHVLDLLARGEADGAVLIRPTGIDEIRRTAEEGLLMPPKSTFFTPKLRTGLVLRPLLR